MCKRVTLYDYCHSRATEHRCVREWWAMSHFTRMRTTLTDGDVLERSLGDLGHQVERGQVSVRGYMGQRTPVELRVPTKSRGYAIGFRRDGADFFEASSSASRPRRQRCRPAPRADATISSNAAR
jgi:Protein of unknown function (DUF1257)